MDYIDRTSLALSGVKALQKQIKLVINECGFKITSNCRKNMYQGAKRQRIFI